MPSSLDIIAFEIEIAKGRCNKDCPSREKGIHDFIDAMENLSMLLSASEEALVRIAYLEESIEIIRGDGKKIAKLIEDGEAEEYSCLSNAINRVKGE